MICIYSLPLDNKVCKVCTQVLDQEEKKLSIKKTPQRIGSPKRCAIERGFHPAASYDAGIHDFDFKHFGQDDLRVHSLTEV